MAKIVDEFKMGKSRVVLKELSGPTYYLYFRHNDEESREIKKDKAEGRTAFLERIKEIRDDYERTAKQKQHTNS
jgi:hypothetical protein